MTTGARFCHASDGFLAQAFHDLMKAPKDFLFRGLEIIESRALSITESLATEGASKDGSQAITGRVSAMIV
jgi:hypothetical protein